MFDFDNHDGASDSLRWQEEANALRKMCENNNVPCLVERSRSGKGAHVWYFSRTREVKKLRQFGAALLDKGAESVNQISFDTYDRMIPAQDKLPSGGLGNLVALPLQGRAVKAGNSVFVDANWQPYYDQWDALKKNGKISSSFISEKIAIWGKKNPDIKGNTNTESQQISIDDTPWENMNTFSSSDVDGKLRIVIADKVYVEKTHMKPNLQNKIRRLAAYNNPEYFYGKRIDVAFAGKLYPEQKESSSHMLENDIGVLSAATGFGKTVVGSYLIAERKVNTLILVHTNEIMQNWLTDLDRFLEINEDYPQYTTQQ